MTDLGRFENKQVEIRNEMQALAHRLRALIAAQPPHDLLGYIYAKLVFGKPDFESESYGEEVSDVINESQFLLEYVHAVLASTPMHYGATLDEAACAEIFEVSSQLKQVTMLYAMVSSRPKGNSVLQVNADLMEFHTKSIWVILRGNRHQVLEGEFYGFVLRPHDSLLRNAYGIGSVDIASGFQNMADAVQTGHAKAIEEMHKQFSAVQEHAKEHNKSIEEAVKYWLNERASGVEGVRSAFDDVFHGGICNVSKHTNFPRDLLSDLAYERGEELDFFADGDYSGTPFRTLPARKKPLIKIDDDYYSVDPCFARDAGYRALLWNLQQRRPDCQQEFKLNQKIMSESAFFEILSDQFQGAAIYQEVYYKDVLTNQWVENDTLIIIDDILILVEAKSGAAATIASPELDYSRHVQAIQDLIIKAYRQCKRFFEYLNAEGDKPIYKREDGRYIECGRLSRAAYRAMIPIGLTVESFSPFSAMAKELPEIEPLLGKHPFISLSIDDLFVLKRFLPTMGQLAHYLEVRQIVSGMKGVFLFDEHDHLGAYISRNRFDMNIQEQQDKDSPDLITWTGMSEIVDSYFKGPDWHKHPIPAQVFPDSVSNLLSALDKTRKQGWLSIDSQIRNSGAEARNDLGDMLTALIATLNERPYRCFLSLGDPALFIWLQQPQILFEPVTVKNRAAAVGLANGLNYMNGVVALVDPSGVIFSAERVEIEIPTGRTAQNNHVYEESERIVKSQIAKRASVKKPISIRRVGRNEKCWCGSELKYKKCHGK